MKMMDVEKARKECRYKISNMILNMKDHGITYQSIADSLDVDVKTVRAWRDGNNDPSAPHYDLLRELEASLGESDDSSGDYFLPKTEIFFLCN